MKRTLLIEVPIIATLFLVISVSFIFVYRDYLVANTASWQQVTYRVMDSMLPFQERFHTSQDRYAFGIFDRARDERSLAAAIDWKPSITDTNRYIAHVIGTNTYKVIATTSDGQSLCRLYPSKQNCFDTDTYLLHGL